MQGYIAVNAAVEGEVCLLGVHGVVVAVVHADRQQIFLFEMFGQVNPKGGIAALVLGQLFAVQVTTAVIAAPSNCKIALPPAGMAGFARASVYQQVPR